MDTQISDFLQKQTSVTICCIDMEQKPWCFSCFYAFNSKDGLLYYKSSDTSRHSTILKENPVIAGSVLPDKLNKLMVRGIQLTGIILKAEHELSKDAAKMYYASHPLAITMPGQIWTVQLDHIKMTDSTIGFAKKISWSREQLTRK
jgi:uncharacterized protein